MKVRVRRTVVAVAMAGAACATSLALAQPADGVSVGLPRSPLIDPCMPFTDPNFAYTPEQASALIQQDYASLRQEIAACQGKALTELKRPKLKKPKVPKISGLPPTFWVYVMGSQVKTWNWSLPLEPDPVMCTAATSGQRFTVVSPVPTGTTLGTSAGDNVAVSVSAGVVDRGWGRGSDCNPRNWAGTVAGQVSVDLSTEGIRLDSWIGSQEDLGWEFTADSDADFFRKFSKKDKAALLNPRKGTLTFALAHNAAGSAQTDTGSCSAWGSDGTCTWAHSWGLRVILVRADPMDLVTGP